MPRKQKFTILQVANALRRGAGIYGQAAAILGCETSTVSRYVARTPLLQKVRDECGEAILDLAETKLIAAVKNGNLTAITFVLRTKGRARGWGDKLEIPGMPGKIEVGSDTMAAALRQVANMTPEQIRAFTGTGTEDLAPDNDASEPN